MQHVVVIQYGRSMVVMVAEELLLNRAFAVKGTNAENAIIERRGLLTLCFGSQTTIAADFVV